MKLRKTTLLVILTFIASLLSSSPAKAVGDLSLTVTNETQKVVQGGSLLLLYSFSDSAPAGTIDTITAVVVGQPSGPSANSSVVGFDYGLPSNANIGALGNTSMTYTSQGGNFSTFEATFRFTPPAAGNYQIALRATTSTSQELVERIIFVEVSSPVLPVVPVVTGTVLYPAPSSAFSSAFINATEIGAPDPDNNVLGIASSGSTQCLGAVGFTGAGDQNYVCDEVILAPKGGSSPDKVARIKWILKDSGGAALDSRTVFNTVSATITGPGLLSLSIDGVNNVSPTGRSIVGTPATKGANTGVGHIGFVDIYGDGNSGESTITLKIGSLSWTKTIRFYGEVATISATQGLKVIPADIASISGCYASLTWCDGKTVGNPTTWANAGATSSSGSVAVALTAKDANGVPVPYLSYSAESSDQTKILGDGISTLAPVRTVQNSGTTWFQISAIGGNNPSGSSATVVYKTKIQSAPTPTYISSAGLKFTFGGPLSSATAKLKEDAINVGALNRITITGKDEASNAPFDADWESYLTSDYAIQTALNQSSTALQNLKFSMFEGIGGVDFYNPTQVGSYSIKGWVDGKDGEVPISVELTTSSKVKTVSDIAIAADEITTAISTANDAANAAVEALDVANIATQDAQTALTNLKAQVLMMVSGINSQITRLTKLILKLQKKLKA